MSRVFKCKICNRTVKDWSKHLTLHPREFKELVDKKLKMTEYFEITVAYPRVAYRIIELLKKEGPLTRPQIIEKLGLRQSFIFPRRVQKFGSRRRYVYYLEGQQEIARKLYEDMVKPPTKPPTKPPVHPKGYFLKLLGLESKTTFYYRRPPGTPNWWERTARARYTCSICDKTIERGKRYIRCRKLKPGYPGVYGWRGTYYTYYYHIKCLLKQKEEEIKEEIGTKHSEIRKLEREIMDLEEGIVKKNKQIETHRAEIEKAREEYDKTSSWRFWRKRSIGRLINRHSKEISRLEAEIVNIEDEKIPARRTRITELEGKIGRLETRLREIRVEIEELTVVMTPSRALS